MAEEFLNLISINKKGFVVNCIRLMRFLCIIYLKVGNEFTYHMVVNSHNCLHANIPTMFGFYSEIQKHRQVSEVKKLV